MPSVLWQCWLGIWKSSQPVDNWVMRCWHSYRSAARCKWFAYDPADVTATPSSLASRKSRFVQPFCCHLTQAVLEKETVNQASVCHYQLYLVLASEKWRKQSTAPSVMSLAGIYRKDEVRPPVGVSPLSFLQCFVTVICITGRTIKTTCAINPWRFFFGTEGSFLEQVETKNKVRKQADPSLPAKQPLNRGCCCHYQLLIQGSAVADKPAWCAASWRTCCKQVRWMLTVTNLRRS